MNKPLVASDPLLCWRALRTAAGHAGLVPFLVQGSMASPIRASSSGPEYRLVNEEDLVLLLIFSLQMRLKEETPRAG